MFNINKLTLMATFAAAFLAAPSVSGTALPESCRKAPVSVRMMLSEMARNPEAAYLDGRQGKLKWNYTTGLELLSFMDVAERYDLDYPVEYVKEWADTISGEDGSVYKYKESAFNVDHVCPARMFFRLYGMTGEQRYRRVLRKVRAQLDSQPRTADGIFWHKAVYPHQVWLDGLYMAQPFYAEYTGRHIRPCYRAFPPCLGRVPEHAVGGPCHRSVIPCLGTCLRMVCPRAHGDTGLFSGKTS